MAWGKSRLGGLRKLKKAALFSLIFLTWYLSAMFRYFALQVLFATESLLLICMFFQSRYLRSGVSVSFPERNGFAEVGTEIFFRMRILNKRKLPVSRLEARIRLAYRLERKNAKKKLRHGAETGESELRFGVRAAYCGLIEAVLPRMDVYDYLAIFSARKRLDEKMEIAVFPRDRALHLELPSFELNGNASAEEHAARQTGDSLNEIRQIREYRTGDSKRHIHWNQSAKTDNYWIKEYEKETDSLIEVLADVGEAPLRRRSAFYELLSALVLGLLRHVATVRVYWVDQMSVCHEDIRDMDQCREMLLKLYRLDAKAGEALPAPDFRGRFFSLDTNLRLLLGDALVCQFNETELDDAIAQKNFVV
jgi:uncharacterized protein (DUF58 family)